MVQIPAGSFHMGSPSGKEDEAFVHQVAGFLKGIETSKPAQPDFREAYRTQLILDAVLASAKDQKWTKVEQA